jgi:hypothetical protein
MNIVPAQLVPERVNHGKENLQAALQKQAAFGADLDLKKFDDNNDVHLQSADEMSDSGKAKLDPGRHRPYGGR